MKLIHRLLALSAAAQCCAALAGQPEGGQLQQRIVYLNGSVAGVYDMCVLPDSRDVYLGETFFRDAKLARSDDSIVCQGKTFWKPALPFTRDDANLTISGTAKPSDYLKNVETLASTTAPANANLAGPKAIGVQTLASVLEHEMGLWRNPSGEVDATLALRGQQYTPLGLFSLEGFASSSNGHVQSYVSDASWKRDFTDAGIASRVGVNTFSSTGNMTTLYGAMIGTDDRALEANATQFIQGFAEVPGMLQIRAGGQLVKELPVSAGYFQIPTVGLPATPGAAGIYHLTLIDAAGRTVRSWDVFVPTATNLLRPGAANWKVFAGQIENNFARNSLISGPRNVGMGFVYRRGLTETLTGELSAIIAERTRGAGIEADFAPTQWMSVNGGATKYSGDVLSSSTFAGVDLHSRHFGVYTGYTRLGCSTQYLPALVTGASASFSGECQNLQTNGYVAFDAIGRISVLRTATIGASPHASTLGLNWSLPSMRRLNLSAYATRQTADGTSSYAFGVMAIISLSKGTLTSNLNIPQPHSESFSTLYSVSDERNNQYSIGADVNRAPSANTSDIQASASFSPLFGFYQMHLLVNNTGGVTAGLNESGALVFSQGQVVATQPADRGYSIVHLKGVTNVPMVDSMGIPRAITNRNGYAVVPAYLDGAPDLKVSPDELPTDVAIDGPLVGPTKDQWSAMLFSPTVHHVNRGWVKLERPNGSALPVGAEFKLEGAAEPTVVLDDGQTFILDLPTDPTEVEVVLPGDIGRCIVRFPGKVKLTQSLTPDSPVYQCTPPTR